MHNYILGIDPSGNHKSMGEGNGHSAFALYDRRAGKFLWTKDIQADEYTRWFEFWKANVQLIKSVMTEHPDTCISLEDYKMYASRQSHMGGQRNPTLMLLGIFWFLFESCKWDWCTQMYRTCRSEIDDDYLVEAGYLTLTTTKRGAQIYKDMDGNIVVEHCRDAMAHAIYADVRLERGSPE